jgi:hypothetical protein
MSFAADAIVFSSVVVNFRDPSTRSTGPKLVTTNCHFFENVETTTTLGSYVRAFFTLFSRLSAAVTPVFFIDI